MADTVHTVRRNRESVETEHNNMITRLGSAEADYTSD